MTNCEDVFYQEIGITCKTFARLKVIERENKMMRECLEFYAKLDSWENAYDDIYPCHTRIKDDSDPQFNYTGGFRARKVLRVLTIVGKK
jgi:hypothetical protein